jgi:hypothetical protein
MQRVASLTGVLRLSVKMELCGKVSRCSIEVGCGRCSVVLSGKDGADGDPLYKRYIPGAIESAPPGGCYSSSLGAPRLLPGAER